MTKQRSIKGSKKKNHFNAAIKALSIHYHPYAFDFSVTSHNGSRASKGKAYQEVLTQHKHGLWAPNQGRKPQSYHF